MLHPKPILIVFCCVVAIVVGAYLVGTYYFDHRTSSTTPEVTNSKPASTAKEHLQKEHSHGDVWHDETTTEAEHTADSSLFPNQTEIIIPDKDGTVLHDETQSPNQAREAKKLADYDKQRAQYFQDHEKWSSKFSDSWDERMRRSNELLRLMPDTVEEVNRLSDEEKQKLAERMMEQLSRIAEAHEELESVEQEEPILPPPPENN